LFGFVKQCDIVYGKNYKKNRGYGFVIFDERFFCSNFFEEGLTHIIKHTKVDCKLAISREQMNQSRFLRLFSEKRKSDENTSDKYYDDTRRESYL